MKFRKNKNQENVPEMNNENKTPINDKKINDIKEEDMAKESNSAGEKAIKKPLSAGGILVKVVIALLVVIFLFAFGFTYQVREGSCAVVMRFGAVRKEVTDSGFYFKLPWPFENVVSYDSRLQYLESKRLETTTKDKRNIIMQSYVVWNIEDPIKYHNSVGVTGLVESYINDQVFSATNSVLGAYDLSNIVSLKKSEIKLDQIQNEIFERVKEQCKTNYGVKVEDVSILRLTLPDSNLESVFEQMYADRYKTILEIISNAKYEANKIETDAETEASKIKGEGVKKAAEIRAKVETDVAKIYADAQSANLDLFNFLKNLDTMVESINPSSVLVVKADQYPFNILTKYSEVMNPTEDGVVINDLTEILCSDKLSAEDRTALITALQDIVTEYNNKINGTVTP